MNVPFVTFPSRLCARCPKRDHNLPSLTPEHIFVPAQSSDWAGRHFAQAQKAFRNLLFPGLI